MRGQKKSENRIYLDSYVLQRDMRIRLPREIGKNLLVEPGKTYFEIYLDPILQEIVLIPVKDSLEEH